MKNKTNIIMAALIGIAALINSQFALGFDFTALAVAGAALSTTAFEHRPQMTNMCSAYTNAMYISDKVCPFTIAVDDHKFDWSEYPVGQQITVVDDAVGRKGAVNTVDFNSNLQTDSIIDYGLQDSVPYGDTKDGANSDKRLNKTAMMVRGLIALNREIRVADTVFSPDSYDADNVLALATNADRFDQAGVNVVTVVLGVMDNMLVRPNTFTFSAKGWTTFRTNPAIVKATNRNDGDGGAASMGEVKALFEIDNIFVGRANRNTGNNPNAVNGGKIWGKHMSLQYHEPAASEQGSFTHMVTVPYETSDGIQVFTKFDDNIGVRGSFIARVTQQVKEIKIAKSAGALITNIYA